MSTTKDITTQLSIDNLCKGPAFAEEVLSFRLGKTSLQEVSPFERYSRFIDLLNTGVMVTGPHKQVMQNFYLGYFLEQAARCAPDKERADSLRARGLIHYQQVIKSGKKKGEEYYYSQLHIGHLMIALEYPWPEAEEAFLKSYEADPDRGEGIAAIIRHYISVEEWAVAYIFSTYARERFFDKMLSPQRNWGVDVDFYNWKVLDLHTAICCQLGCIDEARGTFSVLLQRTELQAWQFQPEEIKKIRSKKELFNEIEIPC